MNVNSYGLDKKGAELSFPGLLREIGEYGRISGHEFWVYFTSPHPRDMSDDLFAAHAQNEKLMPYLHLPIQSGNDRILKAMNRGHTAAHYLNIIERMRKAKADMAISGDFIVGFPGETDQEFEDTLSLVKEVNYASAYSFKYSPRPGTPAAEREDQIDEDIKNERLARLQTLIASQTAAFNASCVGKELAVLLEKPGRQKGQLIGRSPYLQSVHLEAGNFRIGDIVTVSIKSVGPNSLSGHDVQSLSPNEGALAV